ncbi:lectin-like domain-containing protein [Adhaeretor mobilis]|uniref:lectin-like domain-containing protein n=1 Tax=Adhaeretor mobilis TaxID=1930276 RepID=UPI001C54D228|nr:hypothetical protein [Adhaeretor mobilis]
MGIQQRSAHAITFEYTDFSDTSALIINRDASPVTTPAGVVMRLTPALGIQSGSIYRNEEASVFKFSTAFSFQIANDSNPGADGLAFVLQPGGTLAGNSGGSLGNAVPNTVAVEFDTWNNPENNDPNNNHIGITLFGMEDHGAGSPFTVTAPSDLNDGLVKYAWIDYDGTNLEVRFSDLAARPELSILTQAIDISTVLKGSFRAFAGLSAGTGGASQNHDILSWSFEGIPEPSSLFLIMTATLAALAHRTRYTTR